MWSDSLRTEEVVGTLDAVDQLGGVSWAVPLLSQAASIVDRLRVGLADKDAYRANPITPAEMSFLFEIRFARAIASAGLTATYGTVPVSEIRQWISVSISIRRGWSNWSACISRMHSKPQRGRTARFKATH